MKETTKRKTPKNVLPAVYTVYLAYPRAPLQSTSSQIYIPSPSQTHRRSPVPDPSLLAT
ncbi:hypothetical protein M419DRAFT_124119 [Trichoderma reesei RUT C-30]|uniref:Uncharacterized protein n=1 Tax=Hypocrea jecorina (strain ATCC 56765 / BCRC 32924 / NRRL 11460 / Rut C-30) TaxID=1344414 RepID=A0A024S4B9_HYPJR|nr:hypothetical protein M419DRAFT_124119 [Trichoderma reesei RUT C-30]